MQGTLVSSASEHGSAPDVELQCEPDEIPVRFLTIISAGVTAVTLVMIFIAVWLFNTRTAYELAAKGYDVEHSVPVESAGASGE